MKTATASLGALLALGGCDYVRLNPGGGGEQANEAAGNGAIIAPPPVAPRNDAQPSDGGITTSRSLQPRQPGGASGGKDPTGGAETAGAAVNPAQLIGRWGDNGDCSAPIQLFGNGTFRSGNGARGDWRLAGDRLTMSGGDQSITLTIVSLGADEVVVRDSDGQLGRSTRC